MKDFISTIMPNWFRRKRTREQQLQGAIDAIVDGRVVGWVRLEDRKNPICIDLLIDGVVVAAGELANAPRSDVRSAGFGNGAYGFAIAVPPDRLGLHLLNVTLHPHGEAEVGLTQAMELNRDRGDYRPLHNKSAPSDIALTIDNLDDQTLEGWCVDSADRGRLLELDIMLDDEFLVSVQNDRPRSDLEELGISKGLGGFKVNLPLRWLPPGPHVIGLRAAGETLLRRPITVPKRPASVDLHMTAEPIANVSIIVPVFNAPGDLEVCIHRLVAWTPESVQILFIDDASTDPKVADLLRSAAELPNIRVLRNQTNLGFTKSVNRGFEETGRDDIIILNSDARVTKGWVEGMVFAAHSAPKIATVTPMSDRAGLFSAPRPSNSNTLPADVDEITFSRAFRRQSLGLYPSVPTGNGFCMFIRRACIDDVGGFDANAFPRGYGEENDFCMRSIRNGWRHVIDDRTYVFHARSKSFGSEGDALKQAGRSVVDQRYPEYEILIRRFTEDPKIGLARQRARVALDECMRRSSPLPRVLFVVSTQSGGTPQTNRDLMAGLAGEVDCWLLQCDGKTLKLQRIVENGDGDSIKGDDGSMHQRIYDLEEAIDPISHRSEEYDAVVSEWLLGLDADIVHIRHLGWHGLSLPKIAKALGSKVVFSFHDFYALCPSVKLLDENMQFCGGTCTPQDGRCRTELWPEGAIPPLKHKWVHTWRQRFSDALAPCDAFVTTSPSARARILKHLPAVTDDRFAVIPHGRDFDSFRRLANHPNNNNFLRILLPGTITRAKGLDIVHEILAEDQNGRLEFHILGEVLDDGDAPERNHPRLICHGPYERDRFANWVETIRPHLGAVFSIWDETYCHTLTELWSVGVPTIVLNFPTLASRVHESGGGWVLPHEDISALYASIVKIGHDRDERSRVDAALVQWQRQQASDNTIATMASAYLDLYRAILAEVPQFSLLRL